MRHLRKGRKFGRKRDQRRALLKSLASSFFMLGRIRTTEAKAKELRPFVERILARSVSNRVSAERKSVWDVAKIRYLRKYFSEKVAKKIMDRAKELGGRSGGYTRIVKAGRRKGDGAKMAILEMISSKS